MPLTAEMVNRPLTAGIAGDSRMPFVNNRLRTQLKYVLNRTGRLRTPLIARRNSGRA